MEYDFVPETIQILKKSGSSFWGSRIKQGGESNYIRRRYELFRFG